MSESESFTIDDAENDGKIKREAGREMKKVASRNSGELYQYFEDVCEHEGRDPLNVLGDGIVRALNNEEFSKSIASIQVDMSQINAGQARIEDAKFVKEISEELGIDSDGDHWLKETVKERIKNKTESPIPRLNQDENRKRSVDSDVRQELDEIKRDMRKLTMAVQEGEEVEVEDKEQDVDDLFEGVGDSVDDNEEEEDEEQEIEEPETVSIEPDVAVTSMNDRDVEMPSSSDAEEEENE